MDHKPDPSKPALYYRLRELIIDGSLRPGTALSERALADQLAAGRTPVREAVKALASDGLLDVVPQRGTFVRQISADDLREIYELRLALEGMAAFLAAANGPSPALRDVSLRLRALASNPTTEDTSMTNAQEMGWSLHEAIFESANNQRLWSAYSNLRHQSGLTLQRIRRYNYARICDSVDEHLEIYDAIARGDGDTARSLICKHIKQSMKERLDVFFDAS